MLLEKMTTKAGRGFTLVEMLAGVAAFSVVALGISHVVMRSAAFQKFAIDRGETQQEVFLARTILSTEEGCMANFGNMVWPGTTGVGAIVDLNGSPVLAAGRSGVTRIALAAASGGGGLGANHFLVNLVIASSGQTNPQGGLFEVQTSIPLQFFTRNGVVESCYEAEDNSGSVCRAIEGAAYDPMTGECDIGVNPATANCPAGSALNGFDDDGDAICVSLNCIP
ncbi:MAG: hypothetical protein COT74_12265 [Bdellovibrionales bacterium CG10_big_fil_rev_8_21_14_0_10_45_34]|nr:MAG: hypothetical protein COT74_12265 [Bdellovibrionales bacterium CG10_big_fil_rev_8_21_14_0_10_45_34]